MSNAEFPIKNAANKIRTASGRYASTLQPLTREQIDGLIAGAVKLVVPAALKWEWRQWPMERRADFIQRLRARLRLPTERPTTSFSANVKPFDYTTPEAWEVANEMNQGRDSRYAATKLNICSQGVIYRRQLWFWCHKVGYQIGPWNPENGRLVLHRQIWEEYHGRLIPSGMVCFFKDGNRNNFAVENLALATKDDICRQNQAAALIRESRERAGLLLKIHQKGNSHAKNIKKLHRV